MFDKKLFTQHISNTCHNTLQEQGSPIMASEKGKFAVVPRTATRIAAESPEARELQRRQRLRRDIDVAARRATEAGAKSSPYATKRWNQITGEYEEIMKQHDELHEQLELRNVKSAAKKAIEGINKIDRSEYPKGEKGDRLYNTEKKMHIDGAKRDVHPRHHEKLEDMIQDGIKK